jgi:glycine oxidase
LPSAFSIAEDAKLRIGIIGAGVVGAAIAYELSNLPGLQIQVFDQRSPQSWQATGAALGVLIAVASTKLNSKHLHLRFDSLKRFETLILELEAALGQAQVPNYHIPYNRQGILELCEQPSDWVNWQQVVSVRQQQGWALELLSVAEVGRRYPQLQAVSLQGGIYSPQDRQVDPVAFTQALITVAEQRGVEFYFNAPIESLGTILDDGPNPGRVTHLRTNNPTAHQEYPLDHLVIAAGVGSKLLTESLGAPLDIRPVLGQALQLRLPQPWFEHWPVVQGSDVHLVPISSDQLWVGATVEFPQPDPIHPQQVTAAQPSAEPLEQVHQQALHLCPGLAQAEVIRTWSGWRPRPQGRAAPIIEPLGNYNNVLLATGHYRNGVLLAPITALKVKQYFLDQQVMP